MWKLAAVAGLCLLVTISALCQAPSKYQVATIVDVQPHVEGGTAASDATSYDVSVRVGDTIYVALYTPRMGRNDAKYATGLEVLVQVGKNTITYNDIMGRSYEVPIQSQRLVSVARQEARR